MEVVKYPTNQEEILYQRQPGHRSHVTIGGAAPDGARHLLPELIEPTIKRLKERVA